MHERLCKAYSVLERSNMHEKNVALRTAATVSSVNSIT